MSGILTGVSKSVLWLWEWLHVLPDSQKQHYRQLTVVKWTFSYQAAAMVDIPAVSMPTARSLKTCDIVLCVQTAHFRLAFYCDHPNTHLCSNDDVRSAAWFATPVRWRGYSGEGEDLNKFVTKNWQKWAFCVHKNVLRSYTYIYPIIYIKIKKNHLSAKICLKFKFLARQSELLNRSTLKTVTGVLVQCHFDYATIYWCNRALKINPRMHKTSKSKLC